MASNISSAVVSEHHAEGSVFDKTSGLRVIDLSNFEERKQEIAQQLVSSAKDVGFFFITGSQSVFDAHVNAMRWSLVEGGHRSAMHKSDL